MDSEDDYFEIVGSPRASRRGISSYVKGLAPIFISDGEDDEDADVPELDADDEIDEQDAYLEALVTPPLATPRSFRTRTNRPVEVIDVEEWSERRAARGRDGSEGSEEGNTGTGGRENDSSEKKKRKKKKKDQVVPVYSRYAVDSHPFEQDITEDRLDWLIIFQRFIILAVLRWHGSSEQHTKAIITAPYLQVPYDRQLDQLRWVAEGIWHNSRCTVALVMHELIGRPIDVLLGAGVGEICTMCHRSRQDRNGLYQYHIEGRPYDDDTFSSIEGTVHREFDWQLGTSCWQPISKGHQMYHQMHTTFHKFEDKWIRTIQSGTRLWIHLQRGDIDDLVVHFGKEVVPAQRIGGGVLTEATTVFNYVIDDISLRMQDEMERLRAARLRLQERLQRRQARLAEQWF